MDYKVGYFATSKAGHDKGKHYIISAVDDQYVYLVNGVTKTLDTSKKKKKIHVQVKCSIDQAIEEKLRNNSKITNDDIKEALARHPW